MAESGLFFYHYTSTAIAKKIKKKGTITKGNPGTILNKMKPDQFYRNEILRNNYGEKMDKYENKADYVILIPGKVLNYKRLEEEKNENEDRHFFYYYDDISICESQVYDKPKCVRSSNNFGSTFSAPSRSQNDIIINLRTGLCIKDAENKRYQDDDVTIFAPKWVKEGLEILKNHIKFPKNCKQIDEQGEEKSFSIHGLSLKSLQQMSRNEKKNFNGVINFNLFGDLEPAVVYSLKDLVRQTVIIGTDETTHYGGLRNSQRIPQKTKVYVCDLIALQFQQQYNSGRLAVIGENLPTGVLDDFIYKKVTGENKPSYESANNDKSNRYIADSSFLFDKEAYIKFIARDFLLCGLALESVAKEKIHFKFVKYGCGFYAGQFSGIINSLINQGVAAGLKELLPKINISSIELIFFERDEEIIKICSENTIEVKFSNDDPLKESHHDYAIATTNCADNHACIGNPMDFNSVDGAIARNLSLKGRNFCPNINQKMKEVFLDI